ncbi:MAG TPA: hypothetical protein VIL35_14850 [Vicinamibacterales bacterium]
MKPIKTIRVPKTPKRAFNTARPAGDLLRRQAEHLEWAFRPASQRGPRAFATARAAVPATEGEIAKRIAELTAKLMPSLAAPKEAVPPSTDVTPAEPPASEKARSRGPIPRSGAPVATSYAPPSRTRRRGRTGEEAETRATRRRRRKAVKR